MNLNGNILKNNNLAALERQASPEIVGAIKKASARTGVDFAYLMEKASAESSFRSDVKAKTSSATGLFQFIEKTWLAMVRDHGEEYGLGEYADKISETGKVTDAKTRKEILELRKDPETAAAMAAEYAADNKAYLEDRVKSDIGPVELYLAHFMGPSGAAGFLQAMEKNPMETAADIFPTAARANYNVFHDAKTGKPRTLAGVYDFFANKFENSLDGVNADVMIAQNNESPRTAGRMATYQQAQRPTSSEAAVWAQQMYHDSQAQQIRLLSNSDEDQRSARFNRLETLAQRAGSRHSLVTSPLQIMELAQLETPRAAVRPRYNE